MTGTNHILSGALIGASMAHPAALPVALVSHFLLDLLPHYGNDSTSRMRRTLTYDFVVSIIIVASLLLLRPEHWPLMFACAALAVLPDALWIPYEIASHRNQPKQMSRLAQFLHDIQWGERSWGLYIEIPFACILVGIIYIVSYSA